VAGRFDAFKGVGVIGDAKDSGQAGKFYYLTTPTGGLEINRVDLSTPSYSINAWGPINTLNHMTSSGGFGGIYVKRGSATTVAAGAENYFSINCNSSNDRALSFNFENSGWKSYQDDTRFDSASGGHFYVKNTDTVSETVTPYVVCFNPTAGW
jgi:hypothetical protein